MAQIDKPNLHFNTLLYTGNNTNPRTITGVGFQPDMVWKKERNAGFSIGNMMYDVVRGLGVNKHISTVSSAVQGDGNDAEFGYFTGLTSDGFSVAAGSSGDDYVNDSSYNYVVWNWKAGGGQGSSNTSGTINTTYTSANTTAGFSICSWTGTGSAGTIGHGLGAVPKLIIVKRLDSADTWWVRHDSLGNNDAYLALNETNSSSTSGGSGLWNSTAPTSSLFSVGTNTGVNGSGGSYVGYLFAEKKGYSKIGKYTGDGRSDGPFVYTGFKPAFVIGKKSNGNADNWYLLDNKRIGYNEDNYWLYPNLNNSEYGSDQSNHTAYHADLLSNGFKIRSQDDMVNGNSNVYVFWAFAENPIVGSNKVPAVAR